MQHLADEMYAAITSTDTGAKTNPIYVVFLNNTDSCEAIPPMKRCGMRYKT